MKFSKAIPKLIGTMYIFIFFKNILQLLFGYLFSENTDIKFYKIYAISKTPYGLDFILLLVLTYECLLFALIYFCVFSILYFITVKYGNTLWIHIVYFMSIYSVIVLATHTEFDIYFSLIMIISGILNWWLFKKWIKEP
ncbi:hypothetical protein [Chryseobacterium sp. Mn2064]|uniref:hypothetical protein n=1 Tax=Chryseobacterium sp. Mn2064 TaxID=3395263 RepID=UPI003BD579E3